MNEERSRAEAAISVSIPPNTIPRDVEGNQILSASITPKTIPARIRVIWRSL